MPMNRVCDKPDEATSTRMKSVRTKGTKAELLVRQLFWKSGVRYRVNVSSLPGRPDIANKSRRFAVFMHGCFWHRHRGCPRASMPTRNQAFWRQKFRENVDRDARNIATLEAMSYEVLVIWECQAIDEMFLREHLAPIVKRFAAR